MLRALAILTARLKLTQCAWDTRLQVYRLNKGKFCKETSREKSPLGSRKEKSRETGKKSTMRVMNATLSPNFFPVTAGSGYSFSVRRG